MKKIAAIVLNNFKNDSRVLKEAVSLKNNGYRVEVAALHDEPLPQKEIVQGISVNRVKLKTRSWSKIKPVQFIKYIEFLYKVIKKYKDFDIFHCNDLNALPIGVIIKKFFNKNVKIVYDAHEYETEINGLRGIQKKLVKFLEKSLIKYTDKVITVSESIANEYKRLYPYIEKPAVVLNTPPYKEIEKKDIFRGKFNIDTNKTIFLYQGGLSRGRGIEILLETFKQLNTNHQSLITNQPVIIFMGYGELEDSVKKASEKFENIYFHPAVEPDKVLDYTCSADFGVSTVEDICLSYRYCLPNKMFEYIMSDIPVIVSNLPEMKRIVEKYQIGLVVVENNVRGIRNAVVKAINSDKYALKKNIETVKKIYNWQQQEKNLIAVYNEL